MLKPSFFWQVHHQLHFPPFGFWLSLMFSSLRTTLILFLVSHIFVFLVSHMFVLLVWHTSCVSYFLSDPGPIIVYACQSLTHSLTDWLTDDLLELMSQPCWRWNELTLVDGIKYLSNADVEMKLRLSWQQLTTAGKAGNSCNSCQSWRQWIDS